MQRKRTALRAAMAAGALALIGPAAAAQAAVSVDASSENILVTGTAAADTVTITPVTANTFRIADAVVAAGSACQASGADAVCDTAKPLRVELLGGDDRLDNRSQVGGAFFGGDGSDVLRSAPTVAVASELQGGNGDDFLVIGSSLGPDVAFGGNGEDTTDYLERTSGPVFAAVEVDDNGAPPVANDGAPGENDNVGTEIIRGTAQAGDDLNSNVVDGDLGADKVVGQFEVAYELETPYPRPASAGPGRTAGVEVDLEARTNSDGDTVFGRGISGTRFADTFVANPPGVSVFFEGLGGDDAFHGREHADLFDGGEGTDVMTYANATKAVGAILGSGDEFPAEVNNSPRDRIKHVENLVGSPFGDHLVGNNIANRIEGGGGSDRIEGGPGTIADVLEAGPGSDVADYSPRTDSLIVDLTGAQGEDRLSGFEGAVGGSSFDWLIGSEGDDVLRGGPGEDLLQGRGGADQLFGDAGSDLASYGESSGGVNASLTSGGPGGDIYSALEGICGGPGPDTLHGGAADDLLIGNGGDDTLRGFGGGDRLIGDQPSGTDATPFPVCNTTLVSGIDTVSYAGRTLGINVSLNGAPIKLTNSDGDFLDVNIDNLEGGNGPDKLIGNSLANKIEGGPGNDLIEGGTNNDLLRGGFGNDSIGQFVNLGTADAPKFISKSVPVADGVDTVTGDGGDDKLSTVDAVKDHQVLCGSGTDQAAIDLLDPNSASDCETQQRGQIDVHPMQIVVGEKHSARRLILTVRCPKIKSKQLRNACKGTVVIRKGRRGAKLGSKRYRIRMGKTAKVAVVLRGATTKNLFAELTEVQRNKRKRTAVVSLG